MLAAVSPRKRPLSLLCALPAAAAFLAAAAFWAYPAAAGDTAESVFHRLPAGIFENTPEPISEDDKDLLLERGYISNWVVMHKDADSLLMAAMSPLEAEVRVRLFRSSAPAGGGVAVLGARTSDSCAAELWRYDAHGGSVPVAGPPEPSLADFFRPGYSLPPGVSPSYRLCLEEDRLEAKPLFWNESGITEVPVCNRVFFFWNGTEFVKQVERAKP